MELFVIIFLGKNHNCRENIIIDLYKYYEIYELNELLNKINRKIKLILISSRIIGL